MSGSAQQDWPCSSVSVVIWPLEGPARPCKCTAVIDFVMEPGDLMAFLLPWQPWTVFEAACILNGHLLEAVCHWFFVLCFSFIKENSLLIIEESRIWGHWASDAAYSLQTVAVVCYCFAQDWSGASWENIYFRVNVIKWGREASLLFNISRCISRMEKGGV